MFPEELGKTADGRKINAIPVIVQAKLRDPFAVPVQETIAVGAWPTRAGLRIEPSCPVRRRRQVKVPVEIIRSAVDHVLVHLATREAARIAVIVHACAVEPVRRPSQKYQSWDLGSWGNIS
jgi:hypothetical protein